MSRDAFDRLLVRAPAVGVAMASATRRLPAGSPVRRRALALLVKRGFAAMARSDVDVVVLSYEPGAEVEMPGMGAVGVSERYRGRDGIRTLYADVDGVFGDWRWEVREIVDGGHSCAIRCDLVAHGRGSGAETALRDGGTAFRFSERGLIAWQAWFIEDGAWERALEAAGLCVTDVT